MSKSSNQAKLEALKNYLNAYPVKKNPKNAEQPTEVYRKKVST